VDSAAIAESRALRVALTRFRSRRDWFAAPDATALAARLDAHLAPVRTFAPAAAAPPPPSRPDATASLHVVHWNVLHGVAFDAVCAALLHEPQLAGADLVSLNEVDVGMTRSGGRDVAFDLARSLGMHAAWAAQFLEVSGGVRPPRPPRDEPGAAWFGLALLSRHPLADVRRIELPTPEDALFERERKAGRFVALVARVLHPRRPFTAVVTHLDVHSSPAARAEQMRVTLDVVPDGAAILAGDLNTTTFARGGVARSIATLATMAILPRSRLRSRLLWPDRPAARPREPLFALLRAHGFTHEACTDRRETLDVHFDEVHELDAFAVPLRPRLLGLLRWIERRSVMRLDWIAARGFAPAASPAALPHLMRGAAPASDHAPIACRVAFP
jgi:endonuclease/exonuclease/phosphatase family metal-dependent hydrolase